MTLIELKVAVPTQKLYTASVFLYPTNPLQIYLLVEVVRPSKPLYL